MYGLKSKDALALKQQQWESDINKALTKQHNNRSTIINHTGKSGKQLPSEMLDSNKLSNLNDAVNAVSDGLYELKSDFKQLSEIIALVNNMNNSINTMNARMDNMQKSINKLSDNFARTINAEHVDNTEAKLHQKAINITSNKNNVINNNEKIETKDSDSDSDSELCSAFSSETEN